MSKSGGSAPPLSKVGGQLPPLPPLLLHHWTLYTWFSSPHRDYPHWHMYRSKLSSQPVASYVHVRSHLKFGAPLWLHQATHITVLKALVVTMGPSGSLHRTLAIVETQSVTQSPKHKISGGASFVARLAILT